jgi:hypothetical protein
MWVFRMKVAALLSESLLVLPSVEHWFFLEWAGISRGKISVGLQCHLAVFNSGLVLLGSFQSDVFSYF